MRRVKVKEEQRRRGLPGPPAATSDLFGWDTGVQLFRRGNNQLPRKNVCVQLFKYAGVI